MVKAEIKGVERLQGKLKWLEKELGRTSEESVKESAVFAARELGRVTEPFGTPSGKLKELGMKMIQKDVANSYASNRRIYFNLKKINVKAANAYSAALNKNDFKTAEKLIRKYLPSSDWSGLSQDDQNANHLKRNRDNKGRVKDRNIINLIDESQIAKIADDKIKNNTFLAKVAWYQAGQDLGMKTRVPAWMKRGKAGFGSIKGSGSKVVATIRNTIQYVMNVLTSTKISKALNQATKNQVKFAEKSLNKITKQI